ncbi:hypothetical protein D1AOALGA4SA_5621 [Olavius algarvensis Delta 1 endosymbiont]|nr:hypothetical protein D1AOALGA4SA_5621 [Olavius algarvensis Delta 1 endosymbiont]
MWNRCALSIYNGPYDTVVGWVEPDLQSRVAYLDPNYEILWFNCIRFPRAKPNNSIERVFYFVAENLVLWARSEPLGYAVNLLQAGAE